MPSRLRRTRIFQIILITCTGLFVFLFLLRDVMEKSLHFFQRPLVSAGTWIYSKAAFLEDSFTLNQELNRVRNQLEHLAFERVKLEELEQENQQLKEALNFLERNMFASVSASIVSRSQINGSSTFVIDQGSEEGIQIGDPVIVKDGLLIGKVLNTTPSSATIQTITHPTLATAVSVLGQTQTIGIVEGISERLLKLRFIPQDTQIAVNDLVVTSGLEARVPSGLFIGLVNDVHPEANSPFLEAIIEPMADVRNSTIVHVLIQL